MKELAIGRFPNEYTGGEEIKTNDDAVAELEGNKSQYYIDVKNTRYYFSSISDMIKASFSNDIAFHSCGRAETMVKWGTETNFYIDLNGSRYYFKNEADKQAAQNILDQGHTVFLMLDFNKLLTGKGNIPRE